MRRVRFRFGFRFRGQVLLVAALALSTVLTGCTAAQDAATTAGGQERPLVIASVFAAYDFARAVAGDDAEVRMLVPPGSETHSFEPTPRDILALQDCDLFIYAGGESDAWIDNILASIDTSHMTILRMTNCVATLEEELVEGMEAEEEEGEDEGESGAAETDEHVWTSPLNAVAITAAIEDALVALDPSHAAAYLRSAAAYTAELDRLDAQLRDLVAHATRTTVVFGDRFPFRYLAHEYGLAYFAAFPGCSTATEPNAQTIAFLINKVTTEHIPVVFYIELSNHSIADAICEQTGAQALLLHSIHNVSQDDFDAGVTYLSLMDQNIQNLKAALL